MGFHQQVDAIDLVVLWHKSALEFRGFQPPQGLVGEWRKREVFPEIANSSMLLEDYFHSHNLAGESLYLRILRERSQQIYCASETCWNIFHFLPKKGRWLIPSTFPHSKRHMWRYQIGVCVEPFLTEFFVKVVQPEIRPKKNICLKSLNRIREVEFSFVWKVFFIDLGGQTGGKRVVTPKPRIKTVETRKGGKISQEWCHFYHINEKLDGFSHQKKAGDFWDSGILWFISEGNTWNK